MTRRWSLNDSRLLTGKKSCSARSLERLWSVDAQVNDRRQKVSADGTDEQGALAHHFTRRTRSDELISGRCTQTPPRS